MWTPDTLAGAYLSSSEKVGKITPGTAGARSIPGSRRERGTIVPDSPTFQTRRSAREQSWPGGAARRLEEPVWIAAGHPIAGAPGGKASRWVRMAQPSSGDGYGMHFPLHVGVEVAVVHLGGDPDRPVILGAVPNARTNTPVRDANATESQIKTRSGIRITFDDQYT